MSVASVEVVEEGMVITGIGVALVVEVVALADAVVLVEDDEEEAGALVFRAGAGGLKDNLVL